MADDSDTNLKRDITNKTGKFGAKFITANDPDTKLKLEITNKTRRFGAKFIENIKNTTCMDKNPFIDNLSEYIGNYIPRFECIFKYHLLLETLSAIRSSNQDKVSLFLSKTPPPETENPFSDPQQKLILFLSGILKTPGMYISEDELSKIYNDSFSNNHESNKVKINIRKLDRQEEGKYDGGNPNYGGVNYKNENDEGEEEEEKDDVETKCYITTKRINRVKEMFTTDNVSNVTVQRDIGNIINGEIIKISKKVLSEKWFDGQLLKPVRNKSQLKLLEKEKEDLLNNHTYEGKPDSDLYSKTLTLNILRNTKLYLIKTAELIVAKATQPSNPDILVVLLLTLLQDSTIVGFIKTIQRSEKYTKYYKDFISEANTSETYIGVDNIIVEWLKYIYNAINTNPTIKSSGRVDLEYTYNYMKRLNLQFQKISGGTPENSITETPDRTKGKGEREESLVDPNSDKTKQLVTNYVNSITLFVKEQVDKYDVYEHVKSGRLVPNKNAAELRGSILVCILNTFKRKAFGMFLRKLLNIPEPDSDSSKKTTSNKTKQNPAQIDKYANDKIFKLFLQKLTTDLTGPESKLETDVIETYRELIKDINNTDSLESELTLALSPTTESKGGGTRATYVGISSPTHNRRRRTTIKSGRTAFVPGGNTRIKKKTKKARAEQRSSQ
jgi:hypothetical protein